MAKNIWVRSNGHKNIEVVSYGLRAEKKQCLMTPAMTTVFENITC